MSNLKEKLKNIPENPGVYIMRNSAADIIYVGKARNLRNRIRQYFQDSKNHSAKVRLMVSNIEDFEYIIVSNEVEALILEANLIKENRPKYNIILKDDKQYPYIKITVNEMYPRVIKTREIKKDGAKYYGPYPSAYAVNEIIDTLEEIYSIRVCNRKLDGSASKERPCLNYFINRCIGPCTGNVSREEYAKIIQEIQLFLSKKTESLEEILSSVMKEASDNLEFEKAAKYRDRLLYLELINEKQNITIAAKNSNLDVIACAKGINDACVNIFFVRNGKIVGREFFFFNDCADETSSNIISSFIRQFYLGVEYLPLEILIETEIEDHEIITKWLSEKKQSKVSITVPKKGAKLDLVKMVKDNASNLIEKHGDRLLKTMKKNENTLKELQTLLGIKDEIVRIEAFDISHISGVDTVGAMVVFERGENKKSDYRKFQIKNVIGSDDYASMEEMLFRRYSKYIENDNESGESEFGNGSFFSKTDLIMIDGGIGQVNVAIEVLEKIGLKIPVCGLVKDDFHNTRGIIYNNKEIMVDIDTDIYKLIYKIQEEVHRFAITYHRTLRGKKMFKSELDDIQGIGEKRKKSILEHFKDIDKIKSATLDELLEIKGMNKVVAGNIINYFENKKSSAS